MATSPDAAVAEALIRWHDDIDAGARIELERSRFQDKKIYRVGLNREMNLVDCTGFGVATLQQTLAASASSGWKAEDIFQCSSLHYTSTQQWAQWMRQQTPSADGLLWMSRQFNSEKCIVLFEDRCSATNLTCDDGSQEGEFTDNNSPAHRRLRTALDALGWTADL
jgi:RES domain